MIKSYETCQECGRRQEIAWSVKHEVWNTIVPERHILLCLECFVLKCINKGYLLDISDFAFLDIHGAKLIH